MTDNTPDLADIIAGALKVSTEHGPWIESNIHNGETYCKRCLVRSVFAGHKKCEPHIVSAPAAPQPAQQDAKPIYQYQLATGGWIDQTRDSYEYNKANGVKGLRIVYEVAPQPAQQPLTDEQEKAGRWEWIEANCLSVIDLAGNRICASAAAIDLVRRKP